MRSPDRRLRPAALLHDLVHTLKLLVLWDIDGTLLQRASREHAEALHDALALVHGVTEFSPVEAAGRTDGAIARDILLRAGVSAERIDELAGAVAEAACEAYSRRCPPSLAARVAPSIPVVLDELSAWTRPGLVTGNFEPIARLKLLRAGIDTSSWPGGFGSDSESRADLPPLARLRAGSNGDPWPREHTVVIGDTPRDIACARADGLRVIAIATGPHPIGDLAGADAVLADARELPAALLAFSDRPAAGLPSSRRRPGAAA